MPPPDNKLQVYLVYLNGKEIDTIFYGANEQVTVEDVRESLVNHDGYDPRIEVRKEELHGPE